MEKVKIFIINWVVALGVVVGLEILSMLSGIPLGLLMVFMIVGILYYGQKKKLI